MKVSLKYGSGIVEFEVPDRNLIEILEPKEVAGVGDEEAEIQRAIRNPIDSEKLSSIVRRGDKVTVIASDITRTCPNRRLTVPILRELRRTGVERNDITVIFGLGIHRAHTRSEWESLLGRDIIEKYRVLDSDVKFEEDFMEIGKQPLGLKSRLTPVKFHREAVNSDLTLCVGEVAFHQMAGYSGGYKSILPGVASKETVEVHHSLLTHPKSITGLLDGNPFREQIEKASRLLENVKIINAVQNSKRELVKVAFGDPVSAHRYLVRFCDLTYKVPARQKADIVIASPGGYPKDINLYQSQKAVERARFIVRDGGVIILVAECGEGFGEETFKDWMFNAEEPEDIFVRLESEGFKIGGHKAVLFGRAMKKASIMLVSQIPPAEVKRALMTPKRSIEEALEEAFEIVGRNAEVTVLTTAHIFPGFPEDD